MDWRQLSGIYIYIYIYIGIYIYIYTNILLSSLVERQVVTSGATRLVNRESCVITQSLNFTEKIMGWTCEINRKIFCRLLCMRIPASNNRISISAGPPNPPDPTMGCLIMFSHSRLQTSLHCPHPSFPESHAWVSWYCYPHWLCNQTHPAVHVVVVKF